MKDLRLPGFNAEGAFYRTNNHYSFKEGMANHTRAQAVIPQRMTWWEGIKCGAAITGAGATCATAGTTGIGLVACAAATVAAVDYCDSLRKD
jgi:hypothetical protein